MTPEHAIFIPIVFALGLLSGLLLGTRPSGGGTVLLSLGLALGVFALTHLTPLPFAVGGVQHALGGAPLFDQSPSFSAAEVFDRIESFGDEGRAAYRLETYTGDVLFPLALLTFLLALARFAGRSRGGAVRRVLWALPLAWFAADMVENATIYTLLAGHPSPSTTLAALLGPTTVLKFALLAASLLAPLLTLALTWRRQLRD